MFSFNSGDSGLKKFDKFDPRNPGSPGTIALEYSPKVGALYIRLTNAKIESTEEISTDRVFVDFDKDGEAVRIEIIHGSNLTWTLI